MTATAATRASYKANVVSINQKEAEDKINIARNFYHSIPDDLKDVGLKPVLWTDAANEISFHKPSKTSVIQSQPSSAAIRGGRKDMYFDEAAHIREFTSLYQAGLPAIIRGGGRLSIISTPLGQSGLFYDIFSDSKAYPEFSRHEVPWWESAIMVKPDYLPEAMALADALDTKTRVYRYGADTTIEMFKGFGHDVLSFQTEFECMFVDELEAYYPMELVESCASQDAEIWDKIPENWRPTGSVSIGIDLAKERDQSVFTVVEHVTGPDKANHMFVRYIRAISGMNYADQMNVLEDLVKKVRPSRVSIDRTGAGNMFFESSQKFSAMTANLEGVNFDNKKKEDWATRFKRDLQDGHVHYPWIPDLIKQIHGIRRTKTETNFFRFSAKQDDYFWSLMLACYGESRVAPRIYLL